MNTCRIIAEIGQAHDGSLGILHSYIDALAPTGVDIIKFQTHIADAESSMHEEFRTRFSYVDATRYDYWKRMEFSPDQWRGIKDHVEATGREFMSSPFSCAAVDLLETINVARYKVGSGEISNFLLLEKIARTGKEILLSSGMSSYAELDAAVGFLQKHGNRVSIMQCTTRYPTTARSTGLNVIEEMRSRYGIPVGLSDHSGTIFPSLAAVVLGASFVEVHVVFDRQMFGPDSSSSLTIAEVKHLVEGVRFLEECRNHPVMKDDIAEFEHLRKLFGKSLSVSRDLPAGHVLAFEDLESKKPSGYGVPAGEYAAVVGKRLLKDKRKNDFLEYGDVE